MGICYTFFMKIFLDADGAPWREMVIERAQKHGVTVVMVADCSYVFSDTNGVEQVVVDDGSDAADFAIINHVHEGDLVITQDAGLASLVLPKGAAVISPRGFEFTESSIGGRLTRLWLNRQIRMAGERVKGPPPLSQDDRRRFLMLLEKRLWPR
jgi:hypothetical protein